MKATFSSVTYEQLRDYCGVEEKVDDARFAPWLDDGSSDFEIPSSVETGLDRILQRCRRDIESFSEEEVKMKVVAPLFALVDFPSAGLEEWYERYLEATVGKAVLSGNVDCMIAKGDKSPEHPYFFLQEYKPNFTNRNPEIQLVAEMIAALSSSGAFDSLLGGYVVGSNWNLVLVCRVGDQPEGPRFDYFVSPSLDAMSPTGIRIVFNVLEKVKTFAAAEEVMRS